MEQESEADGDRGRRGGFKETAGMEGRQTRGWAGALFDAEYEAPCRVMSCFPSSLLLRSLPLLIAISLANRRKWADKERKSREVMNDVFHGFILGPRA